MKNIAKVSLVMIGSLIGAGFASGKEIYTFFGSYGINGIAGILVSSILTGIIIIKVLQVLKQYSVHNYQEFLECISNGIMCAKDCDAIEKKHKKLIFKHNKKCNILLIQVLNGIVKIFLLISFYVMVSGFSSYFKQEFNIPIIIGSSIMAFFSFVIFNKNIQGVIKANTFLVPVLIGLILLLGWKTTNINMVEKISKLEITHKTHWFISAILYSSYNSILVIPILIPLKKYLQNKNYVIGIACLSTIIIGIMSLCMLNVLTLIDIPISNIEMPVIYVASILGKAYPYLYGFVIVTAIFTSAICAGYSFLENGKENKKIYVIKNIFLCASSIFVSHFGFSNLVNALYPIFGYLGIIQIFFLFFSFPIEKKTKN